jgi:hypothetical protein
MILAIDQSIEPRLRSAGLTRLDFDMLLDLYVSEHEKRDRCLWDVCQAASGPFSTAHRRLSVMIERGAVIRQAPNGDWRRVVVRLSDDTKLLLATVTAAFEVRATDLSRKSPAGSSEPRQEPKADRKR